MQAKQIFLTKDFARSSATIAILLKHFILKDAWGLRDHTKHASNSMSPSEYQFILLEN